MTTSEPVQTIADIARLAGVSKSTVSRALNDSPLIAADTKERIRAIAKQHRFQMNVPAQRLSTKRSHAIAFVTYAYKKHSSVPDAFMLELQSGVSSACTRSGTTSSSCTWTSATPSGPRATSIESGRADGFILLTATCTQHHLDTLVELRAPFILWGAPPGSGYCSVIGDNVTGGRLATEHLLQRGKSRIAFLGGYENHEVDSRRRGYQAALRAAGIEPDPALAVNTHWTEETGRAAMEELLARDPELDGVFACSDVLAIAAIDVLRERGVSVPEDVGVVGYDDIAVARFCNPPLTTIRQNGPLAGRLLAEHLVQHLHTGLVTNVSIPAELVVRESA